MPRDTKARERKRRYLDRKKAEKYGPESIGVDMRGRHENHARGPSNGRWNASGRFITSDGYVAVRCDSTHPHAWGAGKQKYVYEHHVVAMDMIGRPLEPDEVVHHRNDKRADNRPENLKITTRSDHAREHAAADGARDERGRFAPGRPRCTEVST